MNIRIPPFPTLRRSGQSGFTLTEIAIVLGIIATIIAGIWTAASVVNDRAHLSNALNQYSSISQNMTALMQGGYGVGTSPCAPGVAPCDITGPMIGSQTIPQTYANGAVATNPWGAGSFTLRWQTSAPPTYRMAFYGVSRSGCPGIIMAVTSCNPGKPGCPTNVGTGGIAAPYAAGPTSCSTVTTSVTCPTLPITTGEAATLCAANNYAGGPANSVEFDFTQ